MAAMTDDTMRKFATVLIERAGDAKTFTSVLSAFAIAVREVALDDAIEAVRKRRGPQTCVCAIEEIRRMEQ